jgi:hypothetical protein
MELKASALSYTQRVVHGADTLQRTVGLPASNTPAAVTLELQIQPCEMLDGIS